MLNSLRLTKSMPPAAMVVAILALLVATAGVGYTAATVGTNDLQNDAVTSPKVKDGTLRSADLVKDPKFKYVGGSGVPFSSGGEGDCVWQSGHTLILGLPKVGYRVDRFGTVHLTGLALASNGAGGDAVCDIGETEDGIVFRLPVSARPSKHQILVIGSDSMIIVNKQGLSTGGDVLPAGAVYWSGTPSTVPFDNISFPSAGAKVYGRATTRTTTRPGGQALLRSLGFR